MKINNLNKRDYKELIKLVRNNLKNSVLFYLSDKFIKFSFFEEVLNNKSFFTLVAKKKHEIMGFIIIKKKFGSFSNKFILKMIVDAFLSTFTRDIFLFFKLFGVRFAARKIFKKFEDNYIDSAEIIYIAVEKKYRKKGIGRKLIIEASKKLDKYHKFIITSSENSKPVINFYKRNNFNIIGYETRFKKKNILMVKVL